RAICHRNSQVMSSPPTSSVPVPDRALEGVGIDVGLLVLARVGHAGETKLARHRSSTPPKVLGKIDPLVDRDDGQRSIIVRISGLREQQERGGCRRIKILTSYSESFDG